MTIMIDTYSLPIVVRVGKSGLTESVISEIKKQIKKRKIIKIKFLPVHAAGKNKKEFAKEIAAKTNTTLVSQVGFVVVLKPHNLNTTNASDE